MKVILSIKPEFVEKIIKGEKAFEFRRKIFNKEVESVIVYASSPVKKVVGEFTISEILNYDINTLWKKTKEKSGISRYFFYEYFKGLKKGYAIKIEKFYLYKSELNLNELGILNAPQSFMYFDNKIIKSPKCYSNSYVEVRKREIDRLVYALYDLTEEEIAIVEKMK